MATVLRPRVALVDDDLPSVERFIRAFAFTASYDLSHFRTVDEALRAQESHAFDVAILDLSMDGGSLSPILTKHNAETGFALAAEMRRVDDSTKFIILSYSSDNLDKNPMILSSLNISRVINKRDCSDSDLIRAVDKLFGMRSFTPQSFIVHGHDRGVVRDLVKFIKCDLKWEQPIILDEQASEGLTVIEKFEKFARFADVIFVLMTPDDMGRSVSSTSPDQFRARQNVLFELGFFNGFLRRRSGRVFVLRSGDVEIPSDLSGVIYIDITNGVANAKMTLQQELRMFL